MNATATVSRSGLLRACPLALVAIGWAGPATSQQTFRACYVPAVGAIYMIGLAGLPASCVSEEHREISWTEGGSIADGAIGTAQLADGGVGTVDLADGVVTAAKVAGGAIGSAQIADGAVGAAGIADGGVGTAELADGAVTSAKLGSDVTIGVADGSIGTAQIADGAVTGAKLAANAVGASQITDGSVATAELADDAVTSAKIPDGAVGASEIADGAVGLQVATYLMSPTFQTLSANTTVTYEPDCPSGQGWASVGVGWSQTTVRDVAVRKSHKNTLTNWVLTLENTDSNDATITIWVNCARISS